MIEMLLVYLNLLRLYKLRNMYYQIINCIYILVISSFIDIMITFIYVSLIFCLHHLFSSTASNPVLHIIANTLLLNKFPEKYIIYLGKSYLTGHIVLVCIYHSVN